MSYFYNDNHAIVEHDILKSIDLTPTIIIPNNTIKILGEKEYIDMKDNKYGNDIFFSSLNQNDVLNKVILPKNSVKVIGEKAFEHCHNLSNINFPEGLEEIRLSAFLGCYKLANIELPKSIKVLDTWCFDLIDNLIITYKGTKEEWKKIKISKDFAKRGTTIKTIDGEIIIYS